MRIASMVVALLLWALAPIAPAFADGVRGCDSPLDRSCCSIVESLKGCVN